MSGTCRNFIDIKYILIIIIDNNFYSPSPQLFIECLPCPRYIWTQNHAVFKNSLFRKIKV